MNFEIKFSYDSALGKPLLKWTADVGEYGVEENNVAEYINDIISIISKVLSPKRGTDRITEEANGNGNQR